MPIVLAVPLCDAEQELHLPVLRLFVSGLAEEVSGVEEITLLQRDPSQQIVSYAHVHGFGVSAIVLPHLPEEFVGQVIVAHGIAGQAREPQGVRIGGSVGARLAHGVFTFAVAAVFVETPAKISPGLGGLGIDGNRPLQSVFLSQGCGVGLGWFGEPLKRDWNVLRESANVQDDAEE